MSSDKVDFSDFDPSEDLTGEASSAYNGTESNAREDTSDGVADGLEHDGQAEESVKGGAVDWPSVWDSCNLRHDSGLSQTQIAGAIEVADATGGATRMDQERLCEEARDANALFKSEHRFWLPGDVREVDDVE